ncbi:MAG TPA: hypothetical protein VGJ54_09930 [Streptosporangiaceae bacterium]
MTSAPACVNSTDHAGLVMGHTSTSPGPSRPNCDSSRITRTVPVCRPGEPATPATTDPSPSGRLGVVRRPRFHSINIAADSCRRPAGSPRRSLGGGDGRP